MGETLPERLRRRFHAAVDVLAGRSDGQTTPRVTPDGGVGAAAGGSAAASRTQQPARGEPHGQHDRDSRPGEQSTHGDPLLTPRERVREVLRRHGGSMKQQALGDQVGWSDATVSRRLGDLEDAEAVVRHQIGREKLVSIPGEEPDCLAPRQSSDAPGT